MADVGGRRSNRQRAREGKARGQRIPEVCRQPERVGGIDVARPVQMATVGVGVGDAELVVFSNLLLNGQVTLLGVAVDEVFVHRQGKRKNGDRNPEGQELLIDEHGVRVLGVKTLLVGEVRRQPQGIVQNSLKNSGTVQSSRVVRKPRPGRCAAARDQLYRLRAFRGERIEGDGQQRVIVEDSVAGADQRFLVATHVPSQGEARCYVVLVARDALDHAEGRFGSGIDRRGRREERGQLEVVAHAIVQRQARVDLPAILGEDSKGLVAKRPSGSADALNKRLGKA